MMSSSWNKKGLVFGIVILFIGGCLVPGISSKTNNTNSDKILTNESSTVDDDLATLTFNTFNEKGKKENKIILPIDDAKYIFNLFESLKNKTISEPNSQETWDLKNMFIELLDDNSLIPRDMSKTDIQSLINPHGNPKNQNIRNKNTYLGLVFDLLFNSRFNLLRFLDLRGSDSDWNIVCNIAGGGYGIPLPLFILPRPRLIAVWGASAAVTATGSLLMMKSFIARGNQQGICLGFVGVGLTIAFIGFIAYGMLGYSLFTYIRAQEIDRYNNEPTITNEIPPSGSVNVPTSLSELSFRLTDGDGDLMSYTVTTSPDIGSGSGSNKGNGVYHVPVSGLESDTDYTWYVTVDDGYDTVEETFTFRTEKEAPVVSNPNPSDGEIDVPVGLSQLSFHLKDFQGDPMDYTVETVPDIGMGSGSGVGEGTYSVPVSGLDYLVDYVWYVNVTDGVHQTKKVFSFKTEPLMVFDPFEEGWQYRKKITIDYTQVAGDLEDFPVLISMTDVDLRDKAQFDGDDILFMDGPGVATRLFHEIEFFDGGSGELVAWVNIPSLSSGEDTILYLYYGNSGCGSQQLPERVWDSDFIAVYHMHDSSSGISDSTKNNKDSLYIEGNPSYQQSLDIGYSVEFDGNDGFTLPDLGFTTSNFEMTTTVLAKWNSCDTSGEKNHHTILAILKNVFIHNLYYDDNHNQVQANYGHPEPDPHPAYSGIPDTTNSHLYQMQAKENDEIAVWTDGTEQDQGLTGEIESFSWDNTIAWANGYYYFDGLIDEVRISDIKRSDSWIKTTYETICNPSSFFSVGPEESAP